MAQATDSWTVKRLLEWTSAFFTRKEVDSPRLSAELLLAHVLKIERIRLYTDYERPLQEEELVTYRELVRRAGEHEPIAYLTGKAHFFDLELDIVAPVLIPRPDTETLVENVLQFVKHTPGFESPRIADLCTGSGCIALALAKHIPQAHVAAVDIDPKAIELTKQNAQKLGLGDRVTVLQGDLFEPLSELVDPGPFHLIVSNPPYIPSADIAKLDRNVRDFESRLALDGGVDGLAYHRRLLAGAAERLLPCGRLYMEIAFDQGEKVMALAMAQAGLSEPKLLRDYGGKDRVLVASKA